MKTRIVRAALWLVPSEWRETVRDELQDTAEAEHRGAAWIAWQASRAGLRLRSAMMFDNLWFDGHHAARSLMRAPWFTAGAVLTFALGIGINVAVFTAVDRVLFRTLPYERPDELVLMRETDAAGRPFGSIAMPLMTAVAGHQGFLAMSTSGQTYGFFLSREDSDAPPIRLTTVTHNTLEVFGVRVIGGRGFTADDARQQKRLALISYDAWQRRFGAAADIVGRPLWSGGNPVEIAGVLPRSFIPPSSFLDLRSDGLVLDPSLSTWRSSTRHRFGHLANLEHDVHAKLLLNRNRDPGANETQRLSAPSIRYVPGGSCGRMNAPRSSVTASLPRVGSGIDRRDSDARHHGAGRIADYPEQQSSCGLCHRWGGQRQHCK